MNIVVWGAGTFGKRCISFLPNYGINVVAFIDSDEKKIGNDVLGIPVISLGTYEKFYDGTIILIAMADSYAVDYIENILIEHRWIYFVLIKCPSELYSTHVHERVPFDEYMSEFLDELQGQKLAVSGWNFFSLLLYNYLSDRGAVVFWLVSSDEKSKVYGDSLADYDFILEDELEYHDVKHVFCTSAEKKDDVVCKNKFHFMNFNIPQYRNDELKKNFHMHDGQRCFVVANGPSLEIADLQCLHERGELCFGVNGIYCAFQKTDWRPDFYVVTDSNMFKYYGDSLLSLEIPHKYFGDSNADFWKQNLPSNVYKYHIRYAYDMHNEVPISDDVSVCAYDAGTVVHSVLQFAFYMGFKEIYIIGADCQLLDGSNAHFDKNYCSAINSKYILLTDSIIVGYEAAKKYADAHGIKIYNATRGGALEVFERVNFDEIFS